MLSTKITVCIFAFNEEGRILRCIDNFKDQFEIMVIDNFSVDKTVELVRSAGYRCVQIKNPDFIETPEVMDPVMRECFTDYVLIASVSEFVPLTLQRLYAKVAETDSHDIVRAFRVSITAGEPIPFSGPFTHKTEGELRFFRKKSVNYAGNQVHGRGVPVCSNERILKVVEDPSLHFYQFRDYDCARTELAHCRYDNVLAKQRFDSGRRFSWSRALFSSCAAFATLYFRYGAYRFGMLGFLHSYYRWQMEFTIWLRIWEWEHHYTGAEVASRNNVIRSKMELSFLNKTTEDI
jgi:glycosyltransferase involved in cell wall biosynthesis